MRERDGEREREKERQRERERERERHRDRDREIVVNENVSINSTILPGTNKYFLNVNMGKTCNKHKIRSWWLHEQETGHKQRNGIIIQCNPMLISQEQRFMEGAYMGFMVTWNMDAGLTQ